MVNLPSRRDTQGYSIPEENRGVIFTIPTAFSGG